MYQHYDQQHNTVPDASASYYFDADDEYDQTINTTAFNGQEDYQTVCAGGAAKRHIRTKRMPSSVAAPSLSDTQLPHELHTSPMVKPRRLPMATSAGASDTIIFTDNQIYVALEPLVPMMAIGDNNGNADTNDYVDENNDLFDEQANLNSYHNNNNHNLSAVSKLTDKCPFHISSQLQEQQRRTAYATNQHNLSALAQHKQHQQQQQHSASATPTAAVFEKVKFDPTKRYLQHTSPTNSSAGSGSTKAPTDCYIPAASSYEAFLYDKCTQARTSSMYVDDQLLDSTFVQYWPFGREPVTVAAASAKLRQQQQQQLLQQQKQQQLQWHQQEQQQQQRRWNAAYERDDGYVQQNAVLDNHRNRIRIDVEGGSPSLSSGSGRSSISVGTAETWLDDEQFDNSLNEELQYRCDAIFAR